MANEVQIDDLLDQWEDHLARNPTASPATFVASVCVGEAKSLANELLDKIEKLQRIMPLVDRMGDPNQFDGAINDEPALDIAVGAEPIPGYVLKRKIASGGYGEVWEATGPGDFAIAMKFVRLAGRGTVEQAALKIAKRARHPNLVVTHGAWILRGYLIIAMELAERTLFDVFEAVRSAGGQGIPREELLRHMADAAAGIDYLNDPPNGLIGVQHRDIKPQNLLIVGGRTKVADFGIARIVQGQATGHTGAMTIAYAAPEFFEGKTTNRSDQYSLAVTYCYLLTGKLPFQGTDAEVMAGHLCQTPDLRKLPKADRSIVVRALAKRPEQRWPSCDAFIQAIANSDCNRKVASSPPLAKQSIIRTTALALVSLVLVGGLLAIGKYSRGPEFKLLPWEADSSTSTARPRENSSSSLSSHENGNLMSPFTEASQRNVPRQSNGETGTLGTSILDRRSKVGPDQNGSRRISKTDALADVNAVNQSLPSSQTKVQSVEWLGNSYEHTDTSLRELPEGQPVLIGLTLSTGRYGSGLAYTSIASLQPIYRFASGDVFEGRKMGPERANVKTLLAPSGQAISAIRYHRIGDRIVGVQVQFSKLEAGLFDSTTSSWSDLYLRVGESTSTIGDGRPFVGVGGRQTKDELRELELAVLVAS